ncbi:MAG: 2-C-methyl-D-erythritol 4-phosphate cytidylyltransferase [Candidatus Aminicenantes bacterium]|nr:2-C-methyl-D-erythritol 4-phosphate cytidylyltransferase [Candidatus Aminicenantes bacterium]
MSTIAVILAGGSGERFGKALPKQFCIINGRSLLEICLEHFQGHPGIDAIVLVCPGAQLPLARETVAAGCLAKVKEILAGGKTRQESSYIGIMAAPSAAENILIHDAARALVGPALIGRVLEALTGAMAVMPALPAGDTIVRTDEEAMVSAVLDRAKLRLVQTPQGFKAKIIRQAHEMARSEGFSEAGDDCSLVLRYRLAPVLTVEGDPGNIKITYPQDLAIAEAILKNR